MNIITLVHPSNKLIDVILAVSGIAALNVMVPLLLQATQRCFEFERPQEVVCLFEVRPNSDDLVNKILNANNTMVPQTLQMKIK